MSKKKIVIVDDHKLIREIWELFLLQDESYVVSLQTGNGNEAVEFIRQRKPDLVILDINMSPLSGFDILKSTCADSPGTKVIAVSIHAEPTYARKMLLNGAKGYVTKNSSGEEFLKAVKEVLAGNIYICQEIKNILSYQLLQETPVDLFTLLSKREAQVADCIRRGYSSRDISQELKIALKTVDVHRHRILQKLNVKNAVGLIQLLSANAM